MADIVKKIGYAMSLRGPQQEALGYLDGQQGRGGSCRIEAL